MKKLLFILIVSLGIFLFGSDPFTLIYECTGEDMFPVFSGNPFVYKATSLGTSLAWTYYLSGMIYCWIFWIVVVTGIKYFIDKMIKDKSNQKLIWARRIGVILSIVVSILSLYLMISNSGSDMEWFIDLEKEASDWGMVCEPTFQFFN